MKKLISIVLLGAITVVIPSCDKDFMELSPHDAIDKELAFVSTQSAMGALNGIHRLMYEKFNDDQPSGGHGIIMHMMDLLGEDMPLHARPNTLGGFYQWTSPGIETGAETALVWQFYYRIIANTNLIIGNIDAAEGTQAERDMIKGQALVYRAWAHFMLVQVYGKRYDPKGTNDNLGVPIMTFESPESKARNTVAKVYTQINIDLDTAIVRLAGYKRLNKSHLDQSVARGIKARVLLTQGQWEDAAKMADLAATGYPFMPAADHTKGYNDYANVEWMWSSKIQMDQNITFSGFFGYMGCNHNGRATKEYPRMINSTLYNQIAATDVRKGKLWIPDGATNPSVVTPTGSTDVRLNYMQQKFKAEDNSTAGTGCVPYMRVAEMYLIAAEGYARAGMNNTARSRLHSLMVTRNNPSYPTSLNSGDLLVQEILTARRIELWGEGFRWLDLKRLDLPLDRSSSSAANTVASAAMTTSVPAGDDRWQWKIPKNIELNANDLIVQNP
ncbi:membrane protein [Bacteroidia bacterium]|nr:membrane protein [Bacteroidia bacterium]